MTEPLSDPVRARREFRTEISIAAPREAVWRALADAGELARWFPQDASVTPGAGGKIVWRWGDVHTWTHTIVEWKPGERLFTRYDSPVSDGKGGKQPLFVDFVLSGEGGATTLRLVQSGFGPEADFDREYDGISHGWPVELRSLKLYLERHRGRARQTTWFMPVANGSADAAWHTLIGPDGFACGAVDRLADGAPFTLRTREGDVFEGRVLRCHPREFSGVVHNLGDAWLRVTVYDYGPSVHAWFWLATYGDAPAAVAAREQRLRAFLTRLFPQQGELRNLAPRIA